MDIHVEFKLASKYQAHELYRCFYLPVEDDLDAEINKEKDSSDSGYASEEEVDLDDTETSTISESTDILTTPPQKNNFIGRSHRDRAPKLSHSQVSKLADQFTELIPERTFSMASLQGYLMAYKTRPLEAVKDAAAWVEKERPTKTVTEPLVEAT